MSREEDPQAFSTRLDRDAIQAVLGIHQDFPREHPRFGSGYALYLGDRSKRVQIDIYPAARFVCVQDEDFKLMFADVTAVQSSAAGLVLEHVDDRSALSLEITPSGGLTLNRAGESRSRGQ